MSQPPVAAVAALWETHYKTRLPPRFKYETIAGVELVLVDLEVAGCVHTWLTNGGAIDDQRWNTLATHERNLERVLPSLAGAEAAYCRNLLAMTVLILES